MKTIKNYLNVALALGLFAAALSFPACEKAIVEPTTASDLDKLPGQFKRTITVKDGETAVTLGIASDNEAALASFESSISIKGLRELPTTTDPGVTFPPAPANSERVDESNAVNICVLEKKLAQGVVAYQLDMGADEAGKTAYYGINNFYSYTAPHYFRVSPVGGNCVSAWFFGRVPGGSWFYSSGGSGGYYLCNYYVTFSSSSTSHQYRLKAQGNNYSVIFW